MGDSGQIGGASGLTESATPTELKREFQSVHRGAAVPGQPFSSCTQIAMAHSRPLITGAGNSLPGGARFDPAPAGENTTGQTGRILQKLFCSIQAQAF